jgi:putative salt-induced outer membrane protein YdiY
MNCNVDQKTKQRAALAAAALCVTAVVAQAQPAAVAAATATNRWETTAAAGLTLTSGNTDTILATLGLQTSRKWQHDEVAAGISGAYGEDDGDRNQAQIMGYAQYNRLFTEKFYVAIRADELTDDIADLDYRVKLSPMAGYYLIKNPRTTLALEAGPSFIWEHYSPEGLSPYANDYVAIRFGERFEHKLTATTKIWESLEYVPQIDRWTEKYLLAGEVGIDTAISPKVSLRVVLQDIYDSEPASGRENNDLRLIAGVGYKF